MNRINKYDVQIVIILNPLRYKTVTSQNVSSEAQIKNFFIS